MDQPNSAINKIVRREKVINLGPGLMQRTREKERGEREEQYIRRTNHPYGGYSSKTIVPWTFLSYHVFINRKQLSGNILLQIHLLLTNFQHCNFFIYILASSFFSCCRCHCLTLIFLILRFPFLDLCWFVDLDPRRENKHDPFPKMLANSPFQDT